MKSRLRDEENMMADKRTPEERMQSYQRDIDKFGKRAEEAEAEIKKLLKYPEDFEKLEKLLRDYSIPANEVKTQKGFLKKAKEEEQERLDTEQKLNAYSTLSGQ